MGKVRARTDEELAARKKDILAAAKQQLMTMEYGAITLATIAEKTSISRPSMYHYYGKKEAIFIDIILQEYQELAQQMKPFLETRRSREQFCKELTDILWQHETLLKLLSLRLLLWDPNYSDSILRYFVKGAQPFQKAMHEALAFQFPDAGSNDRAMFLIQFSVYCNSLYEAKYLPQSQMDAMREAQTFELTLSAEEICYDGLMKLSAELIKKDSG